MNIENNATLDMGLNSLENNQKADSYQRLKTAPIDVVIPIIIANMQGPDARKSKIKADVDGVNVKVSSVRLRTFAIQGTKCSCCGLEASFFAFEKPKFSKQKNEGWHLNLWGFNRDGEEILFTHDHTVARSLGGKDNLDNTTTMCSICNNQKSILEGEEYRSRREFHLDKDYYPIWTPFMDECMRQHKAVNNGEHQYFVCQKVGGLLITPLYAKSIISFYHGNKRWFATQPPKNEIEKGIEEGLALQPRWTSDINDADFFFGVDRWIFAFLLGMENIEFIPVQLSSRGPT